MPRCIVRTAAILSLGAVRLVVKEAVELWDTFQTSASISTWQVVRRVRHAATWRLEARRRQAIEVASGIATCRVTPNESHATRVRIRLHFQGQKMSIDSCRKGL